MFSQLEPYLSVFEAYLSAPDKDQHFDSITDPTAKELVDLLTAPLFSIKELSERMTKLSLNAAFQEFLISKKVKQTISASDSMKDHELLKEIKEKIFDEDRLDYSRPTVHKKNDETES